MNTLQNTTGQFPEAGVLERIMEPVSNVSLASDAALEQILAHAATLQHQAIAVRAHQVFVERGGTHGHDLQDWLVAKRQLFNPR